MGHRFSKWPTWWVRDGTLKTGFRGGKDTGQSIAGLKCLIAIATHADFYSLEAALSWDSLEKVTGLSRPMVSKGLDLILSLGIIEVTKGYPNVYRLIESKNDDDYWAKLPSNTINRELVSIINRGKITLFALKLYLQLLADRPNSSIKMHMKYDTITQKVGTQKRDIKPSIDVLFNHRLIAVEKSEDIAAGGRIAYKKNVYTIKGIDT